MTRPTTSASNPEYIANATTMAASPEDDIRERSADSWIDTMYTQLKKLARNRMRHLRPGQTLQPTALVHEVYLRLKKKSRAWDKRSHFYFEASRAMRNILVEHARSRNALKRGGHLDRVDFTVSIQESSIGMSSEEILLLHERLKLMSNEYPEHAQLVLLYYFGGSTVDEIAMYTDRSPRSVERYLRFARAWLKKTIVADEHDRV